MSDKVLHILSGDLWGGAEAQMLYQISALRKQGWRNCHVLLLSEGEVSRRFSQAQIPLSIIPESEGFFSVLLKSVSGMKRDRPGIIVTHGYKGTILGAVLALRFLRPLIVTYHGRTESYKGFAGLKARAYHLLQAAISRCIARRVITVSHSLARELGFENLVKLQVVYNVSPCISADETHVEGVFLHGRPAIVIVGRLVPVKRIDVAIRAISVLHTAAPLEDSKKPVLYVIGTGPEEEELKSLANELAVDNSVRFLGFRDDAAQLIGAADALLIASDSEGVPTVLLEALVRETGIVCTALDGINEVLARFPGYPHVSFPPGDVGAAAVSIERVLEFSPLGHSSTDNGSEIFKNLFSPQAAAQAHSEIYRALIN